MVDDIFTLVRDRGAIAAVRYFFFCSHLVLISDFSSYTQTSQTLAVSTTHTRQAILNAS